MEVIVGTYNHVLFGFKFNQNDDGIWNLDPLFTDQGHAGCVKSLAVGGKYMASGSSDETIRLFDMKKHTELGTLIHQSGTITCIQFTASNYMLSGSEDGTICIWKCKTWECEKVLKGHRGSVQSLSIHPSGRLALSVSKDKAVKTWNLLTGRPAYTTSIKDVGEIIQWSPKGDCYVVVVGCKLTVYKIDGLTEPHVYKCEKCILTVKFLTEAIIILAGEFDDVIIYNFEKAIVLQRFEAHKTRVKALCLGEQNEKKLFLFTCASDGNVKAWSLNKLNYEVTPSLLASIEIPGRPTCMAVKLPPTSKPMIDNEKPSEEKSSTSLKKKKIVKKKHEASGPVRRKKKLSIEES